MTRQTATHAQEQTATTMSVASGILQRKCACGTHTVAGGECVSCHKEKASLNLQRDAANAEVVNEAPPMVYDVLRSSGQPLDAATRSFFEPRFGHDFSHVRVHTDAKAAESARAVNALAYTVGRDVVFGAGQYVPQTSSGRKLMAHELTHVMQQQDTAQPSQIRIESAHEQSAEATAEEILNGHRVSVGVSLSPPHLARQATTPATTHDLLIQALARGDATAIINILEGLNPVQLAALRHDYNVSQAVDRLPERARLIVRKHLLLGGSAPRGDPEVTREFIELENAAENHDPGKVRRALAALKKLRESSPHPINVGNIKARLDYELRGLPEHDALMKEAEDALEVDLDQAMATARQSSTFRNLEQRARREFAREGQQLDVVKAPPGEDTETNIPSGIISIEANTSQNAAVVRLAHEMTNASMKGDYDRVKDDARAGKFADAAACANEYLDVETNAVIQRQVVLIELNQPDDPQLAALIKAHGSKSPQVFNSVRQRVQRATVGTGQPAQQAYEQKCRGLIPRATRKRTSP